MAAQLFPAVKGLQLVIDTPVDASTGAARDDLIGVKVWYNTSTPNFNTETQGTLAYNGPGLNVFIPDLTPGILYYIKYGLISELDESVYDDSESLSARPLSGASLNVTVSNPVTQVPADVVGNVLSFAGTGTELRVYEGSTELTYDGVGTTPLTWKVVASGSNITLPGNYITDAGTYVLTNDITALSQDKGTVSFVITGTDSEGDPFTITTTQTITKAKASAAPLVDISGITNFNASYDGEEYYPASFVVSRVIANIDNPTYLWAVTGATVTGNLTDASITITPTSDLVSISLTVSGTNLFTPISRIVAIAASYDGNPGPSIDISGVTSFNKNVAGVIIPATSTLSAVTAYVRNPVYSWTVTNGTLSANNTKDVVLTPVTNPVTVTLSVTGDNLTSALEKQIKLPIVLDGQPGQAGANGTMSAFPTIYRWTNNSTPPDRPTTTSTYTWATGDYTAPTDWFTTAPSNTTKGAYLWSITYPLVVPATTTTSTLDWTDTVNAIRGIAYNGVDGDPGVSGNNALTAILTNEAHTIPTATDGTGAVFTGSGTEIRVYEGATELTYDGSGTTAGTWNVTKTATNVTSPGVVDGGVYASIPDITAMSADVGSITFTITGKTSTGASFTLYKTQRFAKAKAGVDGTTVTLYQLVASSEVIVKDAFDATTTGNYTTVDVRGVKYVGSTSSFYGWVTVTGNGDTEATTATNTASSPVTISPASNAGKSSYTVRLYDQATVSGATLLDTKVINVVFKGNSSLAAILTNEAHSIPTDSTGANPVFTNSGTDLYVYEGNAELIYDGVGTDPGRWKVTKTDINVTSGAISDQGAFARVANLTGISDNTGEIQFAITGKTLGGASFSLTKTQKFSKARGGVPGTSPLIYEIITSSPVITKEAPDATTDGTYSTITIQGKQRNGSTTTNYGWITVTPNGSTEATTATNTASDPITLTPASDSDKSYYTLKMYNQATVSGATLLDTKTVYVVFKGATGSSGATGAAGSATFVVTRTANDDSAPTNAEVTAVIGRNPVAGDIVTVSYNSASAAKIYKYVTDWVLFASYITGSLIVQNTITAANMVTGTITAESGVIGSINADVITAGTITGRTYQTTSDVNAERRITINENNNNQIVFNGALGTAPETYGELARLGETTTQYYVGNVLVSSPAIFSAGTKSNTNKVGISVKSYNKPAMVASSARAEALLISCDVGSLALGYLTTGVKIIKGNYGIYIDGSATYYSVDSGVYVTGYNTYGVYIDTPKNTTTSTHALQVNCSADSYTQNYSAVKFGDVYFGRRDTGGYDTFVITSAPAGTAINLNSHSVIDLDTTRAYFHRVALRITKGSSITDKVEIDGPTIYVNTPNTYSYGIYQIGFPATGILGSGTSYDFYANGTGTNYGPFTGGHDGLVSKQAVLEIGDIVVDKTLVAKYNISNTIFEQELSNTVNDPKALGIVANVAELKSDTIPAALKYHEDYAELQQLYNRVVINAVGEGQINVCKDGGNIEAGDYITTSNRPGKGQRQSDDIYHNYTVARARESVTWEAGDDSIKQIACIYLCG